MLIGGISMMLTINDYVENISMYEIQFLITISEVQVKNKFNVRITRFNSPKRRLGLFARWALRQDKR